MLGCKDNQDWSCSFRGSEAGGERVRDIKWWDKVTRVATKDIQVGEQNREGHSRQKEQPVRRLREGHSPCWWLPQLEGASRALQGDFWRSEAKEGSFFLNVFKTHGYYARLGPRQG